MTFNVYQALVPQQVKMLTSLNHILSKAVEYAQENNLVADDFLQAKLADDMLPLSTQIQIATDQLRHGCARLAGVELLSFEDNETTIEEFKQRIAKTCEFVLNIKPELFEAVENKQITFSVRDYHFDFTGANYVTTWIIPNFYFHVTTAYAILRNKGVPIGKRDYLGA